MSISVQRSVVEQFSFTGKKVQSVHVKGEECLVSRDVYKTIGWEEEKGKKAIQNLLPGKYKLHFGDIKPSLNQREDILALHKNTGKLKQRDEAKSFMEWAVDTVLLREIWKLASAIEEKDAALALLTDDVQGCDNQIQAIH